MNLTRAIKGIKKAESLLVTPKVEAFLRQYPDGARFDDDTYRLIEEITQTWGGNDDRSGRFGASSRGKCHRRQVFDYLGMKSPYMMNADTQNLFNDGKWRHLRWQVMAMEAGALTHVEYPYRNDNYRLAGSMDGLNSYDSFGFELKGDRNSARMMDGIPEDHDLQIHSMMLATGWDTFVYINEDKANNNWREIIVRRNRHTIDTVKQELEELNDHVERQQLPQVLPSCAAKQGPYRTCPYASRCLERDARGNDWPVDRDWN